MELSGPDTDSSHLAPFFSDDPGPTLVPEISDTSDQGFFETYQSRQLSSELTSLSIEAPSCPLCKGKRYGFTAYFHNQRIFPEPPHELIELVEATYVLKNRLKSLLLNYAMREIEKDCIPDIVHQISTWGLQVAELCMEVTARTSASGYSINKQGAIDGVKTWTQHMMDMLMVHVHGRGILEMPKGMLNELLVEFKKIWENVWRAHLSEKKSEPSAS